MKKDSTNNNAIICNQKMIKFRKITIVSYNNIYNQSKIIKNWNKIIKKKFNKFKYQKLS